MGLTAHKCTSFVENVNVVCVHTQFIFKTVYIFVLIKLETMN